MSEKDSERAWEDRIAEIIRGYITSSAVSIYAGHAYDDGSEGAAIVVSVQMGEDFSRGFPYFNSTVEISLEQRDDIGEDEAGQVWCQVLQAVGHGFDGDSPLRTRLSDGAKLKVAPGIDAVLYDGGSEYDPETMTRTFTFTAALGVYKPAA